MGNSPVSQHGDIHSCTRTGDLAGILKCIEENRQAINSKDEVSYLAYTYYIYIFTWKKSSLFYVFDMIRTDGLLFMWPVKLAMKTVFTCSFREERTRRLRTM